MEDSMPVKEYVKKSMHAVGLTYQTTTVIMDVGIVRTAFQNKKLKAMLNNIVTDGDEEVSEMLYHSFLDFTLNTILIYGQKADTLYLANMVIEKLIDYIDELYLIPNFPDNVGNLIEDTFDAIRERLELVIVESHNDCTLRIGYDNISLLTTDLHFYVLDSFTPRLYNHVRDEQKLVLTKFKTFKKKHKETL